MLSRINFILKSSRPGLWFPALWLYFLPLSQKDFWLETDFWLGLAFVTFPINFIIYAWNDYVDYETDQLNPRKDSYLFGARGSKEELKIIPKALIIIQAICYIFFIWYEGWEMAVLFSVLILVLLAYNYPKKGFRNTPPLELIAQFGYLLLVPFSIILNETEHLSIMTYVYLCFFAMQSQLIGEVMDIEPDRKANRHTTATKLGIFNTKLLIIGIVCLEAALLIFYFDDIFFGGMLVLAVIWLLMDLFIIFKNKIYTLKEMHLFAYSSNLIALASMVYVWWSGVLS